MISNVPAALILSGFTENARGILLGTDVGGLGTPIASLASLISLKLYSRSEKARMGALHAGIYGAEFYASLYFVGVRYVCLLKTGAFRMRGRAFSANVGPLVSTIYLVSH
jgi:hypothetical protein